jgi:hypothetical protein
VDGNGPTVDGNGKKDDDEKTDEAFRNAKDAKELADLAEAEAKKTAVAKQAAEKAAKEAAEKAEKKATEEGVVLLALAMGTASPEQVTLGLAIIQARAKANRLASDSVRKQYEEKFPADFATLLDEAWDNGVRVVKLEWLPGAKEGESGKWVSFVTMKSALTSVADSEVKDDGEKASGSRGSHGDSITAKVIAGLKAAKAEGKPISQSKACELYGKKADGKIIKASCITAYFKDHPEDREPCGC